MPLGCAFRAMLGAALAKLKKLYTEGVEDVAWVEGYVYYGELFKEAGYLRAVAIPIGYEDYDAYATWVVDEAVDLSSYSTLKVDWENVGVALTENNSWLKVSSSDKTGETGHYDARAREQGVFARKVTSLDISGLSGPHYVHVQENMWATFGGAQTGDLRIYKVWLE